MADVGTVEYNVEVVADKVAKAVADSTSAFDKLVKKLTVLDKLNDKLTDQNKKYVKALGAAGLGGTLIATGRHFEGFRKVTDTAWKGIKLFSFGLLGLVKNSKLIGGVLVGLGKGFIRFIDHLHIAELGIFGLSKAARTTATSVGALGIAGSAVGGIFGGLAGPLGIAAASFGTLGGVALSVLGILSKLVEAFGHKLVESGRRTMEANSHLLEQFIEYERILYSLELAVNGYNTALGDTATPSQFIDMVNRLTKSTGIARTQIALAATVLLDFARITHLNADQIEHLIEISAEYSVTMEQDFMTVIRGVDNTFRGYFQTLQSVGIAMSKSKILAKAYANDIKKIERETGKLFQSMTQAEQAQVLLDVSMKKNFKTLGKVEQALAVYGAVVDSVEFTTGSLTRAQNKYFNILQRGRAAQQNLNLAMGEGVSVIRKVWIEFQSGLLQTLDKINPAMFKTIGVFRELYGELAIVVGSVVSFIAKAGFWVAVIAAVRAAFLSLAAVEGVVGATTVAVGAAFSTVLGPVALVLGVIIAVAAAIPALYIAVRLSISAIKSFTSSLLDFGTKNYTIRKIVQDTVKWFKALKLESRIGAKAAGAFAAAWSGTITAVKAIPSTYSKVKNAIYILISPIRTARAELEYLGIGFHKAGEGAVSAFAIIGEALDEEVFAKLSASAQKAGETLQVQAVKYLEGAEAARIYGDELEILNLFEGKRGAQAQAQEKALRNLNRANRALAEALALGTEKNISFEESLKRTRIELKGGVTALNYYKQETILLEAEQKRAVIQADLFVIGAKEGAKALAVLTQKSQDARNAIAALTSEVSASGLKMRKELRGLSNSLIVDTTDLRYELLEKYGTEEEKQQTRRRKLDKENFAREKERAFDVEQRIRDTDHILVQLAKGAELQDEENAFIKEALFASGDLAELQKKGLRFVEGKVVLEGKSARTVAQILIAQKEELKASYSLYKQQSAENKQADQKALSLQEQEEALNRQLDAMRGQDAVAQASLASRIAAAQHEAQAAGSAEARTAAAERLVALQTQSAGIGARTLHTELAGLEKLQKGWTQIHGSRNKEWTQRQEQLQQQLQQLGIEQAQVAKTGEIQLQNIDELIAKQETELSLQQARVDLDKAGIALQIQTLEYALDSETNMYKQEEIQKQIIELKRKEFELDLQIQTLKLLQVETQRDALPLNSAAREEADEIVKLEDLRLQILEKQIPLFDLQIEKVDELHKETIEYGKDLANFISKSLTDSLFDGKKLRGEDVWGFFKESAKNAFAVTIRNKLGFEKIVGQNLFKDAGGLTQMFGRAFGLVEKQSAQAATTVAKTTTAGAQQAAASSTIMESSWAQSLLNVVGLARQAFGSIAGLATSILGGIFGQGGILNIGGIVNSIAGLFRGGGAQGGSQGGGGPSALDWIGTIVGGLDIFAGGIGNLIPQGIKNFASTIGGGVLKGFGGLVNGLSNIYGLYGGLSALFNKDSGPIGKLYGGLQTLSSGLGVANIAASYGLLGSNVYASNFVGPLQAGSYNLPGGVLDLFGSALKPLLGNVVSTLGTTFNSGVGLLSSSIGQAGAQIASHVAASVAPTAAAAASAAAPAAASAASAAAPAAAVGAGQVVGQLIPIVGQLVGIAFSVKQSIEADNEQARMAAIGQTVGYALGPWGILLVLANLIVAAHAPDSLRGPLRRNYADTLDQTFKGTRFNFDPDAYKKKTSPRFKALDPLQGPFSIFGGAGLAHQGLIGLHRVELGPGYANILQSGFSKPKRKGGVTTETTIEEVQGLLVKLARAMGGAFKVLDLFNKYTKFVGRRFGAFDKRGPEAVARRTDAIRDFGNLFTEFAANVPLGDILAQFVNRRGGVGLKKARPAARIAILEATQGGEDFTRRDARTLGDKFLLRMQVFIAKLGEFLDVANLGIVVQKQNLDEEGKQIVSNRKLYKDLAFAVRLQTQLLSKALPLLSDKALTAVLEPTDHLPKGRKHARRRTRKLGFNIAPSLSILEAAQEDFPDILAGSESKVDLRKQMREIQAAQFNLDQTLNIIRKQHGKKLKETLQGIPEIVSNITQAVQQLGITALQMRDQILQLMDAMAQTMLDLDRQILDLSKGSEDLTPRITELFATRIADINKAIGSATDPSRILDLNLQKMDLINEKWGDLINEVERQAALEIELKQDRIEAIDLELEGLNEKYQIARDLANLGKALKEDFRNFQFLKFGSLQAPGQRIKEFQTDVDKARGKFESADEDKKAQRGSEYRDALLALLSFGEQTYQRPSLQFQRMLREIEKQLKEIETVTAGKEDEADSYEVRIEALDTERTELQKEIRDINKDTKTATEALQKQWADELSNFKPDLQTAYQEAIDSQIEQLGTLLATFFGPGSDIHKFLNDIEYATSFIEDRTNDILQGIWDTLLSQIERPSQKYALKLTKDALRLAQQEGPLTEAQKEKIARKADTLRDLFESLGYDLAPIDALDAALASGNDAEIKKALRALKDLLARSLTGEIDLKTYDPNDTEEDTTKPPDPNADLGVARRLLQDWSRIMGGIITPDAWEPTINVFDSILSNIEGALLSAGIPQGLLSDLRSKMYANLDVFTDQPKVKQAIDHILESLPSAREGGLVLKDMIAQVHGPEVILPLNSPRTQDILSKIVSTNGSSSLRDVSVVVNVHNAQNLNEQAIANLAIGKLKRELQFGSLREGFNRSSLNVGKR